MVVNAQNAAIGELSEAIGEQIAIELGKMVAQVQQFVNNYRDQVLSPSGLQEVNAEVAALMRAEVVSAYQENVLAGSPPSYRAGEGRDAGGALLSALSAPSLAIGTARGIEFIDEGALDSAARQWARLNYGAGPAQGRTGARWSAATGTISLGGSGVTLNLSNSPRPNFRVPMGHFNAAGQFFLGGSKNRSDTNVGGQERGRMSRVGIAPRHFLDAGLIALETSFISLHEQRLRDLSESLPSGSTTVVP